MQGSVQVDLPGGTQESARGSLHRLWLASRHLLLKPGDMAFLVLCALLIAAQGLIAFKLASRNASNYGIYRAIATFMNEHGTLPGRSQILPHNIGGSYADFTAPNLEVYRALFLLHGEHAQRAVYLGYESLIFMIGAVVVVRGRRRLGLSEETARLIALLVVSPVVAGSTFISLEDKALFFTLPLLVLASNAKFGKRAVALGLAAGWGGLSVLAIPLIPLAARNASGFTDRLRVFRRSALGLTVFLVSTLLAGGASLQLIQNRTTRESGAPFWFSIWRLAGGAYSPALRDVVVVVVSILVGSTYAKLIGFEEGFVALTALLLIVSTNTVPSRIVCFLPLGVFVLKSATRRRLYLAIVATWAALMFFSNVAKHTTLGYFANWSSGPYAEEAIKALMVNAILLLILGLTLRSGVRVWKQRKPLLAPSK